MGVVVEIGLFWFFGSPLANFFPIFIKIKLEVKFITVSDICSVFLKVFDFCSADARFSMFLVSADTQNTHSGNPVVEIWHP